MLDFSRGLYVFGTSVSEYVVPDHQLLIKTHTVLGT